MKQAFTLSFLLFYVLSLPAQNEGDQFFSAWSVHEIRFQFAQPDYWDSLTVNYALAERLCVLLADFSNAALDARIDSLADLIRTDVYADTLKFFSNANFELNLSQDINVPGTPGGSGIAGLKSFISARNASVAAQLTTFGCTVSGVQDQTTLETIGIFPNPASDLVQVKSEGAGIQTVTLWSAGGQRLAAWPGDNSPLLQISLRNFPSGIFYMSINTGDALHLQRLALLR